MAHAEIRVTLDGEAGEGEAPRYKPGSIVSGTVEVTPDGDVECRHLYARLEWRTDGYGTTEQGRAGEADLFEGTLHASLPSSFPFQLTLPMEPWSYSGELIRIEWDVAVDVDVPWSINPRHRQRFVMRP